MERFLFLILAVLLCGCEPHVESQPQPDELDEKLSNYQFHDDFYYEPYLDDGKYSLAPCLSEHFIRFTTEFQDEVIAELLDRGFQIAKEPVQVNYSSEEFEIPEGVRYGSKMSERLILFILSPRFPHTYLDGKLYPRLLNDSND